MAQNTINTRLRYKKDGTGETWHLLPCIVSYPAMGSAPQGIDATTLCDEITVMIDGVQDLGDGFEFPMNYDGAEYEALEELKGEEMSFKLSFKDEYQLTWRGVANCWVDSGEVNGVRRMIFHTTVLTKPAHDVYSDS